MKPKNLADLVTFTPNKFSPIHNWFYFKEGFSKGLVDWLVEEYRLQAPILDPFCGSGTTLLAAKQRGMESLGIDVSPLACFVSKAKTRHYDTDEIKQIMEQLKAKKGKIEKRGIDPRIRKLFFSETLAQILELESIIEGIENENARMFFLLALIDTAGRVANVVKVGGSLRKQKKGRLPARKLFFGKCKKMLLDLLHNPLPKVEPEVIEGDARYFNLQEQSVGSVVTSPPYLNKIEYTKVYKLELGMFFRYPQTQLRSFLGDAPKTVGKYAGLPVIAQAYFEDMEKVIRNMHHALVPGGIACINVAGGCFPEELVQCDEIIANIAKEQGFKLKENIVAREIQCHRDRGTKTGTVRESIIVLEK